MSFTPVDILSIFKGLVSQSMAIPVAAMTALVQKIKYSKASTWMQLELELRQAIDILKNCSSEDLGGRTNISLGSGCDLFMKYVTRAFNLEDVEFSTSRAELLRRGERFAGMSMSSRARIAQLGHSFIQDDCTVLIHGHSRVVQAVILKAAESKQFNLIVTEGRPNGDGVESARLYNEAGIPTRLVLDSAVGAVMDQVDLCIVGAEGVMENGGIVNKIGTYQIALVANALNKPFYVAVESYKFARMYPLSQSDTMKMCDKSKENESKLLKSLYPNHNDQLLFDQVPFEMPKIDFTPAKLITLLFTDLGVLTPAAVSDELIRLYQ
eukprot:gene5617-7759_t